MRKRATASAFSRLGCPTQGLISFLCPSFPLKFCWTLKYNYIFKRWVRARYFSLKHKSTPPTWRDTVRSCHPAPPLHYSLQYITNFSFSTKVPFHILSSLPLHYMTTGSIPIPQPAHTIHFQLLQVHATALPLNHLSHTGMPNFILPFLSFPFLFFFWSNKQFPV